MTDLEFVESPRWHQGRLWFSDWGTQEVIAVDSEGKSEVMARVPVAHGPLCIEFMPDGRLLIVAGRDGRLLRREPDGQLVTHADLTGLSSSVWNDIVVEGRGNVYIGNTGFDFQAGEKFAPGSLALVRRDGPPRQVADGLAFPNGMAVTADNSTLVVAESYGQRLTAFSIASDGSLGDRRAWAELAGGYPDGICLDTENTVWYGDVPNKRCVRVREGGEVLETIQLDRGCFACALGGADGKTLFMLAAEWHGMTKMFEGRRTGQVLALQLHSS